MRIKTEHAGAKNRGGFWGRRREAKQLSKKARRAWDKKSVTILRNRELWPGEEQ